ncbi:MAG TPA: pilus assembly protein [Pirellulales bacterium]|nr:pilus assembly protein [Pirellulales bacterium]HVY20594.1 pilus assembly protein [Bauldia sp.]
MIRTIQILIDELARFRAHDGGNIAVIFAIVSVPLLMAVGGALDYARAFRARIDMQDALDAATLAVATDPSLRSLGSIRVNQLANNFFAANLGESDLKDISLSASFKTQGGPSVEAVATGDVIPYFGALFGLSRVPINAKSTAVWGSSRLRVALVLDNTGSMDDDRKMSALKTASHNLLDELEDAATVDGDVYVSIVPFATGVNVGSSNYAKTWLRWDLFDEVNGSCSKKNYTTKSSCENARRTWTATSHRNWNGCVTDRDQNYDLDNTAPSTSRSATLFPAEQNESCPAQLAGLSYRWSDLNDVIDAMKPLGATNQAIGLQWGWQSLTQSPFTIPSYDSSYKYKQVIILLTDGLNTQDRWYGDGRNPSSRVDTRQKKLCQNIKDAGIELYTVQVNTGRDPKSTMLEQCASSTDKFFLLTSADQIVTTFESIGSALSGLRLAM